MVLNILLVLVGYIAHIFLCRYLDLFAVIGREKAPNEWNRIKNETTPALWFIPIIGTIICLLFAIVILYHNWKNTPTGKRFLTGEK
jgi:lipid-A-disaccharide synthase-like uncharacterized protein